MTDEQRKELRHKELLLYTAITKASNGLLPVRDAEQLLSRGAEKVFTHAVVNGWLVLKTDEHGFRVVPGQRPPVGDSPSLPPGVEEALSRISGELATEEPHGLKVFIKRAVKGTLGAFTWGSLGAVFGTFAGALVYSRRPEAARRPIESLPDDSESGHDHGWGFVPSQCDCGAIILRFHDKSGGEFAFLHIGAGNHGGDEGGGPDKDKNKDKKKEDKVEPAGDPPADPAEAPPAEVPPFIAEA